MKYKNKGSIVFKVLIVILSVGLFFAIYIPNNIWNEEAMEEAECQFRLKALVTVQDLYYEFNETYADTLTKIQNFALENEEFKFRADSIIVFESDIDSAEQNKTSLVNRLYISTPVNLDSLFNCPSSGLSYMLEFVDKDNYKILCPTEPAEEVVYTVFKKKTYNHGEINQEKEASWK